MPKIEDKVSAQLSSMQGILSSLERKHNLVDDGKKIADIMTFCTSPHLLNLPGSNLRLFLSQRIVLKTLYMGSRANEDVVLDTEEMQWLYDKKQKNVIDMIERKMRGEKFRISELTMVLGRRSSKTVLASVISAYEIYKLLMVGNGDPYEFYDMPYDEEIAVINVATSKDAAGRLWNNIQARIRNAPFFHGRINQRAIKADRMRIFTDVDLRKKNDPDINVPVQGSIMCLCGHTNYDALRGFHTICLLFDELAFYDESDKVSGKQFYTALAPSVGGFKGKDGIEDGIKVEISSPGPKTGVFYKLWEDSFKIDSMLSYKMPTWDFNPKRPRDDPEIADAFSKDPASAEVEYGAEWPEGGLYGIYFPEDLIKKAVRGDILPETEPDPRFEYYFHVDPALTGDRYVMVGVKRSNYRDPHTGLIMPRITLALTKLWTPEGGMGLNYMQIDKEVLTICQKWRPVTVSYDQWNSIHSLQMLRRNGINCLQTSFNRAYKQKIYQNLRDLMQRDPSGLYLYDHFILIPEILNLKYKPTPRGVSIGSDPRGDVPTDDFADCLAGSAFLGSGHFHAKLPAVVTVRTGML